MATKFVFKFQNDNVGPVNFQLVDADVRHPTCTVAEAAAQMLCYFASVGFQVMGGATRLVECQVRPFGAPGGTALPFPTSEYATVLANGVIDGVSLAGMASGYATQISAAGALCPLGTSISVSEVTSTAGPTGRGRHFLPFIGVNTVDVPGSVKPGVRAAIDDLYFYLFKAIDPISGIPVVSPMFDIEPVVTNAAGTPTHQVVLVKAQPVFSNLESRRR